MVGVCFQSNITSSSIYESLHDDTILEPNCDPRHVLGQAVSSECIHGQVYIYSVIT